MKRMLINATHEEEVRVALVDGQKLIDLDIEHRSHEQKKSNIYKARITRVEPSLEAVFVDYGAERHGFLPFKEISREYLSDRGKSGNGRRPDVGASIKEGKELIVQVEKEERSNKGAALTTFISLAGRFLVLMPNNPRAGGVSRRIEGEERNELRAAMNELNVPKGMGTIVRTAGVGRNAEELQWDLDYQCDIWRAIEKAGEGKKAPFLIYQESNIIVRALRDNFRGDVGEIVVDEQSTYSEADDFIKLYMPQNERKLKMHTDVVPLFNRYQIESQIESAFRREVTLPSGGSLVIDRTEALISIDINSARATKGTDIEETATNTNLEAADEVARQLRLRDLGGLVVIDFIDMMSNKNQRAVETRLRDALKVDRARVQIGRISRFGLLEMSRQRLRPSLGEASEIVCPRCSGSGKVRGTESTALSILRLLEEEAMKDNTLRVVAEVPVEVATYLLNEKRSNIASIEERNDIELLIVANSSLDTPNYEIERVRQNESDHQSNSRKSFEMVTVDEQSPPSATESGPHSSAESAAVRRVVPGAPAPTAQVASNDVDNSANRSGGIRGLIGSFGSIFKGRPGDSQEADENVTTEAGLTTTESDTQDSTRSGRTFDQSSDRNRNSRGRRGRRDRNNRSDSRSENTKDSTQSAANESDKTEGNRTDGGRDSGRKQGRSAKNAKRTPDRNRKQNSRNEKTTAQAATENVAEADEKTASDASNSSDRQQQDKDKRRRGPGRRRNSGRKKSATTNVDSGDSRTESVAKTDSANNAATVSTVQPSQLKSSVKSLAERQREKARLERGSNDQTGSGSESNENQPSASDAGGRDAAKSQTADKPIPAQTNYVMGSTSDFGSDLPAVPGKAGENSSKNSSYAERWSSYGGDAGSDSQSQSQVAAENRAEKPSTGSESTATVNNQSVASDHQSSGQSQGSWSSPAPTNATSKPEKPKSSDPQTATVSSSPTNSDKKPSSVESNETESATPRVKGRTESGPKKSTTSWGSPSTDGSATSKSADGATATEDNSQ